MKWTMILGIILAAGVLVGCNLPGAPIAEPAHPANPAVPADPLKPVPEVPQVPAPTLPCLESGDQNTINAQLQGPGSIAMLCPQALFQLTGPVVFTAANQQIYTQGQPTGDTRATLRIVSPDLTTAVLMRDHDGALLSNVIVDGDRANLGPRGGDALIYAGGYSDGQIIRGNKIMDPRSWSALQLIEGFSDSQTCRNALVENNEIGPAGTSDNLLWADGISFTCTNSTVRNNVITDATDGGIVVFGAPGSVIEGNTIRAETRTLLGGINMVDDVAYDGNYTGTIVRNNVIDASGAVIRIGLGMGPRVWGCFPPMIRATSSRAGRSPATLCGARTCNMAMPWTAWRIGP